MQLHDLIRYQRKEHNMTLAVLAKKVGISLGMMSRIETGERFPSNHKLEQIIAVLHIQPSDIEVMPPPILWREINNYLQANPATMHKIKRIIQLIKSGDIHERRFHLKLDETLEFKYNKARRVKYANMRLENQSGTGSADRMAHARKFRRPDPEADPAAGIPADDFET